MLLDVVALFLNLLPFFFFLLSLVPGIIQAQYTSAQETLTELDNVSKAYFQIQYLLLSVTDPNKF